MGTESTAEHLRRSIDEPDAFGGFHDAHFEGLLRYLTRRTCDAEAGLDLTAESFAQAFLGRRRFRGTTDAGRRQRTRRGGAARIGAREPLQVTRGRPV